MMKQIDSTAEYKPHLDRDKRDQDANRHRHDNLDDEDVEVIRPSIPSIIPLKRSSRRVDDGYAGDSSSPLDDDSSVFSLSSLVSEVTLMTFSEEKAAMLKSEFLSRVQQETQTRPLSREEKVALLVEIQADQDKKFKTEIQRREAIQNVEKQGEKTKHEFFERLNALRVNNEEKQEVSGQLQEEQEVGGGSGQNIIFVLDKEHTPGQEPTPDRRAYLAGRRASLRRRQSVCSDITEKRSNSCRSLLKNERYSTDQTTTASASSLDSNSESNGVPPRTSGTTTAIGGIETVIELKMEIANQQATIDTITARLHNLEIENTKLSSSLSREKKARMAAEKLNADLTTQLRKYYEEGQLQSGVLDTSFRPPMMKQSSTVDWGDDDNNHMNKDGSDRSIIEKVKVLEETNERLSRENMRLSSLLHERKESIHTDSTDVSTSLDSSEHKSSAELPRTHRPRRARLDEGIGASLRSLGTSIKIPFTKMPRSRSDFGMNEFATFQEELMTQPTPSPTSLDNDEKDSQGFSTSTNTTDLDNDNNENAQGGVLHSHKKAQRRWSSGDEWRQKQMEESARETRRVDRRRWSSYKEIDDVAEEGKGVGGWLNGFFGKSDEDVDGKSAVSSQRKNFSRKHTA